MVSTFDTNIMAKIAPFIVRGADNKAVVENDVVKMNVAHIPCRCGFGHKVKIASKRDGTGTVRIQEMRCYKLEIAGTQQQQPAQTQAPQPQGAFGQAVAPQSQVVYPFPPQNQEGGADDLPF